MLANATMEQDTAGAAPQQCQAEAKLFAETVEVRLSRRRKATSEGYLFVADSTILEEAAGESSTEVETVTAAGDEEEHEESACIHCGGTDDCDWKQYETQLREEGELLAESCNKTIRFKLYQKVVQQIHGHLGAGNRTPTPGCVHVKVKELWPEAQERDYVGYQPARKRSKGGTALV
jgi:hypothetical protein